jgi:hypothetical protein
VVVLMVAVEAVEIRTVHVKVCKKILCFLEPKYHRSQKSSTLNSGLCQSCQNFYSVFTYGSIYTCISEEAFSPTVF